MQRNNERDKEKRRKNTVSTAKRNAFDDYLRLEQEREREFSTTHSRSSRTRFLLLNIFVRFVPIERAVRRRQHAVYARDQPIELLPYNLFRKTLNLLLTK